MHVWYARRGMEPVTTQVRCESRISRDHLRRGLDLRLLPFPCSIVDDTILTANPAGLCRKTRTLRRVFLFLDLEFVHEVL